MKIVFALGGSIVVPNEIDGEYVDKFAKFALKLAKKHTLSIVVGGGKTARRAISESKKRGENNAEQDYAGIKASRYNASIVSQAMGIEPVIPDTITEARKVLRTEGIVFMGGTEPGHSTDAGGAMLAEYTYADLLIKVTDVDGIYDKDPQKFKDAKLLKELTIDELDKMVLGLSQEAGKYELFDMLAVKILKRSQVKCIALNGHDLKNIENAIEGKKFKGTTILSV